MALRLQITLSMNRLFLSGQMTCAMLLGAGLLLRAQAALHPEPASPVAAETRPSELTGEHARTAPRIVRSEARNEAPAAPRVVHKISHTRKGLAHRVPRSKARKCGVALAERGFRCG